VLKDGRRGVLPAFAAIGRAAHENAVARGVVSPIVSWAQLVERDVAEISRAVSAISNRYITGDSVVLRGRVLGFTPTPAAVAGVGNAGIDLPGHNQLLRIFRIHRNRRLIEEPRCSSKVDDLRAGRKRQRLGSSLRLCFTGL